MKIALDAMGGDYAPAEIVRGAVQAVQEHHLEVCLVGRAAAIEAELAKLPGPLPGLEVAAASEVVEMDEHPAKAVRAKKDSSIVVATGLVKSGQAAAVVSAGNSGAVMAAALMELGRLGDIERPAIGTVFPTLKGLALLLDIGANADCKAHWLLQFAQMGSLYMERVFGRTRPRVGLLSIGEEETKGNQLVLETHELLKRSSLNFIGNVEGKELVRGVAEVVVTDGFTGNVAIKISEGVSELIMGVLRESIEARPLLKPAALLLLPAFRAAARRLDYTEYGAAPLLGVRGVVLIGHGRSNAKAIKSALLLAKQMAESDVLGAISNLSAGGPGSPASGRE